MDAFEVADLVAKALAAFHPTAPEAPTIGKPWTLPRIQAELALLRDSLVVPRIVNVRGGPRPQCWLVALEGQNAVYYDSFAGDFGLSSVAGWDELEDLGVHGDLPGVFMAR